MKQALTLTALLLMPSVALHAHPGGQFELYDHVNDPAEDHNLAQDPAHAGTLKDLRAALQAGWRAARPAGSSQKESAP